MTEVSSSIRDSRKSSVLTIESKTNEDKGPLEKDDLTGEEDENESIVQECDFVPKGSEGTELVANENASEDNVSILERYIKSLQSKSSLKSLESYESLESNESSLMESKPQKRRKPKKILYCLLSF